VCTTICASSTASADSAFVFVQKFLKTKAVVTTLDGNAYVLHVGADCALLARYEGKNITVESEGAALDEPPVIQLVSEKKSCPVSGIEHLQDSGGAFF